MPGKTPLHFFNTSRSIFNAMTFSAENYIEHLKNELLAALYEKNGNACKKRVQQIHTHIQTLGGQIALYDQTKKKDLSGRTFQTHPFSENHEKRLRQILIIFKRFTPQLHNLCSSPFSRTHTALKNFLSQTTRTSTQKKHTVSFESWERTQNLSPYQKDLVYKTLMTFQLTCGCSNYCRRCNEWALPGVRSGFSFNAATRILALAANRQNTHLSLYGASDPLDWTDHQKDISHIIDFAESVNIDYSLLTKLPRGRKNLLKKLIHTRANLSVSVTRKNKRYISDIEQEIKAVLSKQHDTDDLLIPAGLDEDFISVKPSITDDYGCEITPDAAYIIIPTFTSALYPFGHAKLAVTKDTIFFPEKKTGRQALLVDYFKPLSGYTTDKQSVTKKSLLPVQIETILLDNGGYELTPPGMRSMKEYLSIFDDKARLQRKKMTPTVMEKLKQRQVSQAYVNAHQKMCQKNTCLEFKFLAVSFFLDAVLDYQDPTKLKIILFLLKDEIEKSLEPNFLCAPHPSIDDLLSDHRIDAFKLFRWLVFQVITHGDQIESVRSFVAAHPSQYDPATDLFVPKDKGCR